ncbi:MAG: hypothetical protein LBO73_01900 [Holosporaceae bacterium]|jgi:hypothetical protein|nr:hypothetical protein [Holosporaceae bacterium]
MKRIIGICQQSKRFFSIVILVLCLVFNQESQCRLTKDESIQMVNDAVKAEYITSDTGGKLIAYFSNPEKRKELGNVLFQTLNPKSKDDSIFEVERVLDIKHHMTNTGKRLRAIANLLLPCWTGGMSCYRVTKQAHSLSFLLYVENKERITVSVVLYGWKIDTFKSIGSETTKMLAESVDVLNCEFEKALRLIACSELIDKCPVWKNKTATDSEPTELAIEVKDITQILPTPNTFKKTTTGDTEKGGLVIDGNCLYTTLKHLFLILISKFGTEKVREVAVLPSNLQAIILEAKSLLRLLTVTQHDVIRAWNEHCATLAIEHTPTAWGIASGLAKLGQVEDEIGKMEEMRKKIDGKIPLLVSKIDMKLISLSIAASASKIAKRQINCEVIAWRDGPYWASELIILHDIEADIWIGIGCGELQKFLREAMPPLREGSSYRGLHAEIIGIWSKPVGKLNTTLKDIAINAEEIRPLLISTKQ